MTLRNLFLQIILFSSFISFSQDVVNTLALDLKKNKDVFQIVNNEKKETILFISDKVTVKAIRLNEQMQISDSISTSRADEKKYDKIIGHTLSQSNPTLYWSSNNHKEIISQTYDFETKKFVTKEYVLPLKDERLLQKFSKDDTFYLLTIIKKSNIFKLHKFKNGQYEEKSIELKDFRFFTSDYKRSNLYGVLEENLLPFEAPFSLNYMEPENLTSITDAAYKRKCYFDGQELVITLDLNIDYTQVIVLDLINFTAVEKLLKKPEIKAEYRSELNSNSFYFNKKLYQIKTSSDRFYLTVKDLNDTLLKEYTANSAKPFEFINAEINQENTGGSKKVIENNAQFIKKLNNLNSGLSCYQIGDNTLITIGSVSEAGNPGAQAVFSQFGFIGAIIGAAMLNPTMSSFNSYANRQVVKTAGLFDKDNNHQKGDLKPLAYDKIRIFFEKNKETSSQILFKMQELYYVGSYDKKTKEYTIRKFAD